MITLQKQIWKLKTETLGTSMMIPMKLWMDGHSVAYIVEHCNISTGHFCKEALRMKELLTQIIKVAKNIGNIELVNKCTCENKKLQRGLPFIESIFLK